MGSKKKTTEEFKQEVYDLVGDEYTVLGEYINSKTKIKIKHNKCGYEYEVLPHNFLRGDRCKTCSFKKKTTEEFKQEVYDLVGDEYTVLGEYINSKFKIKIRHNKCGHEYEVKPHNFKNGTRCPKCSKNKKKNIEEFKKEVYNLVGDEYTILSKEYTNNKTKIKIKHNKCGNEYEVTPHEFLSGRRCPNCYGSKKKTTEEFKQEVYDLVGDEYTILGEYINNHTDIKIKHNKCGHEYETAPHNFLRGCKCPNCYRNLTKTTEEFKEEIYNLVGDEYTVLGDYKNSKTKIKIKHNKCGHEYEVTPVNFLKKEGNGRRCPKCSRNKGFSKTEKEVLNFLQNYNLYIKENDRSILDGKEIDILINNKIGIEFDGLYWHSDLFIDKNYHLDKTNLAKEKNIRLIHIFEDEWFDKKEIVKSKIKNILNLDTDIPKIYARKCYIKEISSLEKNNFLNTNHIQGEDKSNIKLGLYYNDKLVSVMTFVKPRRALGQKTNKYDYELSRFASRIDYHVVGAFSKLFKYFERNYEWNKVITYADKRWSEGNIYIKNGWKHIRDSKPNYWYTSNNYDRYHRYTFRKQVLKEKFPDIYEDNLTEFEIMDKTMYSRIWDCGNMVFEYIK